MKIFFSFLARRPSINPLHDGKRNLSGRRLVATGKIYEFSNIKEAAKKHKITINDLVTSCLSTSIQEYFKQKGDLETNKINLVLPANIRFKHYESVDKLKLENRFAIVPLEIPLYEDIRTSLKEIPKAT